MNERPDPRRPGLAPASPIEPSRRDVLAGSGAAMAGFLCWRQGGPAGAREGFPIPAEKGFSADWIRSLYERGEPAVARGRELRWIGMPVGGIGCGQVYLGGDGKLWLWDVLNQPPPPGTDGSGGAHYERPPEPSSPFHFGFALHVERKGGGTRLAFGPSGFDEIEFRGTWPIGSVAYRSKAPPLEVELEAFSPFVPLELDVSSLPATLVRFRLRNTGDAPMTVALLGTLDNPIARSGDEGGGDVLRTTYEVRTETIGMIVHYAEQAPEPEARPDIPFDDFERADHAGWTAEGTAFGHGPLAEPAPGAEGERCASSHARAGEDAAAADERVGALTSREFVIERSWINFRIGGGAWPDGTCVELLIDGGVWATASGRGDRVLRPHSFYVGGMEGRLARLRIVDRVTEGGGNLSVDSIVFSDRRGGEALEERGDFGTLALGVLGPGFDALLTLSRPGKEEGDPEDSERATVGRRFELAPGGEGEAVFVIAWHFPNPFRERLACVPGAERSKHHYTTRFPGAEAVARHVAEGHSWLAGMTRFWRDTWYDSTLPYWLLDRTFASVSTLATSAVLRLDDGRFLAAAGRAGCDGFCGHAWLEAQAPARLFPALERERRERIDLGLAFHDESGAIAGRGESGEPALDAQACAILAVWREHVCSPDDSFLRRTWARTRKAIEWLLARDGDQDGLLDGAQPDSRGCVWHGSVPWLSSLYLAAARAGEAMAEELGDPAFAARCRKVREAGARSFARLFDGEYFAQVREPAHDGGAATGTGCASAQVLGEAWTHQLGLGRILPERETRAALQALWKYNLAPDVGPYRAYMRARLPGGRWLARPGEAGLATCTWPKGGHEVALGKGQVGSGSGEFNECKTGLEHQVAAHMLWEGLIEEGLAVERALHDRYHPAKRNPYSEIECGDHDARALASYGVYLAVCGFELHGPKGHLGFVPRLTPDRFRAAFTAAEGWGTYSQEIAGETSMRALVEVRYGRLRLTTLRIGHAGLARATTAAARLGERELACTLESEPISFLLRFAEPVQLAAGEGLLVECRA